MPDNAIKTEFLIHDLKIPIAVIDAGAKSLLDRRELYGPLTEKQVKVLNRILRNTIATQRLVNDALELGKSRQGVVSKCDFTVKSLVSCVLIEIFDLLDSAVSEQIYAADGYDQLNKALEKKGTRLSFPPDVWKAQVHLDEAKVRQIIRNLLTNAFKHRKKAVEFFGTIENNHLVLEIKDDGPGIPKKDHSRIFEFYFTTGSSLAGAVESHGLGLAGVMMLLKDMGGALSLESDEGKGASFIVSIPMTD